MLLHFPGTLQIRYSLGGLTEPHTIDVDHRNLANGQPHSVNVTRNLREIRIQVSTFCQYRSTWPCHTKYRIRQGVELHWSGHTPTFWGKEACLLFSEWSVQVDISLCRWCVRVDSWGGRLNSDTWIRWWIAVQTLFIAVLVRYPLCMLRGGSTTNGVTRVYIPHPELTQI